MDKKFQKGDLVKLKSGGPVMTVKGYEIVGIYPTLTETSGVICCYFDETTLKEGVFLQETLELMERKEVRK